MKTSLEEFRSRCPGVLGSLVTNNEREIIDTELPTFLEIDTNELVGQIFDIYIALEDLQKKRQRILPEHDIILTYSGIVIYCRVLPKGLLVLLAEADANKVKLRSLSSLLVKKISTTMESKRGQ